MRKYYFLGLAAGRKGALKQLLTHGSGRDARDLVKFLQRHYDSDAVLTKNGRSALTIVLKAYFEKGDKIIVNGFTCHAVVEAIKAAGLSPVYADINKDDLNFNAETLTKTLETKPKGIIVQNTLGNPVDMVEIEKFAKKHDLVIIEDLAHCVGVKYPDGREAGTVGTAAILSFGKEKSIDATSGGAAIFHAPPKNIEIPTRMPNLCDYLRERWYPTFAAWTRGLTRIHLGGIFMRVLVKLHFVQRSADNKLDTTQQIPNFEAKIALEQFRNLKKTGEPPLREFYLVRDRAEVLQKLKDAGYYFDGFWYEKPVSPERYYRKANFDEKKCPVATEVAAKIINFPAYYDQRELAPAKQIIEGYLDE